MKIIEAAQGSQEWLQIRSQHFTASEAPAMLGLSKFKTRQELLREKATGLTEEVDANKQRLFDAGHASEAAARPLAEAYLQEDLFPATGSAEIDGLPLLASFDGLNMEETLVWENKLASAAVEAMIASGDLGGTYWPQVEQQMMVSGASRALFTACDGEQITAQLWYESQPERRAALIAGWKQFAEDLAGYQHVEAAPVAVAAPISELPSLAIEITGSVVASNLVQWRGIVTKRIADINTDLQSDQDFADADKMVKFLGDGEDRIKVVKAQAQSQAVSIDEVFRALDDIIATMRAKRLELDKLVKARKENIRAEISDAGFKSASEYIAKLNARIGHQYMPAIPADFAGVMSGKKTIASLRNAVDTEVARVKILAGQTADRIILNLKMIDTHAHIDTDAENADYGFLFRDVAQLVLKDADAVEAIVKGRIAEHKAAEEKRLDAERDRQAGIAFEAAKIPAAQNTPPPPASTSANAGIEATPAAGNRETSHGPAVGFDLDEFARQAGFIPATEHIDDGRRMKLGEIQAALGFTVGAEFLSSLGFVAQMDKQAKLYRAADFKAICNAIAAHCLRVAEDMKEAA